jgi:multiple sugar transport system substrate-binding protein
MRGLDFTTDDTLTTTFLSMILSKGGQYWVNGKFSLTSPEAVEALQVLVDYVAVDRLCNTDSATSAQGEEIDGAHFLGRDEAMMVPRGPWVIALLDEEYGKEYGVDFDFIKFPFYGSTPAFPSETGWSMCVPKDTKVAEAAWEYVRFFLRPENLIQHNINCAQLPPRKSVATNPQLARELPYMAPLLDILQYGKFIGPFNTDVLKISLRNVYVSLAERDGTYGSVAEALAALERQLNTDLRLN